jgi:hypothetical protein
VVVFAAVRELTEVEADECDGLDLKIVPGKRDQNYMCMNTPGTTLFVAHVCTCTRVSCMKMKCVHSTCTLGSAHLLPTLTNQSCRYTIYYSHKTEIYVCRCVPVHVPVPCESVN